MDMDRRVTDRQPRDTSSLLAILYTIGYFGMVFTMMLRGIPQENRDAINQLIGSLTIIQTGIVAFYFGGSKAAELVQKSALASKDKSDAVIAEIAKTVPTLPPAGQVVTPGPVQPGGVIPAAEAVTTTDGK